MFLSSSALEIEWEVGWIPPMPSYTIEYTLQQLEGQEEKV